MRTGECAAPAALANGETSGARKQNPLRTAKGWVVHPRARKSDSSAEHLKSRDAGEKGVQSDSLTLRGNENKPCNRACVVRHYKPKPNRGKDIRFGLFS